jgi:hypothetical protein
MIFRHSRYNFSTGPGGAIAVVVALLAATAAIVSAVVPAESHLSAEVLVDADRLKAYAGLEPDFEFDLKREAAFITGATVLDAALKRPETAGLEIVKRHREDAAGWLGRRVHVDFPTAKIVRITLASERTAEAALLVNAVAAAYVDEMVNEIERLRAERVTLLERGQRDVVRRLSEKRDAIGRLEKLLAVHDPEGTEPTAGGENPIDEWQRELTNLRIAVTQGEEMDLRLTAELARLKMEPQEAGVALRRRAAL